MRYTKVVTLEEAIRRSGLKDGMTISFHHHFRGGDKVVNLVVANSPKWGFKNLHLGGFQPVRRARPAHRAIRN